MTELQFTRRQATTALAAGALLPLWSAACAEQPSQPNSSNPAEGALGAPRPAPPVRPDLYYCDGCEAAHEQADARLSWSAQIARPGEQGEPLILRGRVLQSDARTPAADVIVYAYQTSARGLYEGGTGTSEAARRHGRIRGWIRTGADGLYEFHTVKPGVYPNRSQPAHIHLMIAEAGRSPYWLDEVVFSGEFGVDARYRSGRENRGGSGIVELRRLPDGRLLAERNIVLERHPE